MTQPSLSGITPEFKKVLDRLNAKQSEAVHTIEGPVLVIAGPGTGKTQILSARIGVLLASDALIQAHNILCLTYTDAGAIAMRKRLQELIGPQAYRVPIYTFHAFCNVVIQENLDYFGIKNLQVISDLEKIRLFKTLMDGLPKDHRLMKLKNPYNIQKKLLSLFSDMKKENWTPEIIAEGIASYKELIADDETFKYQRKSGNKNKGDYKKEYFEELDRMDDLMAAANLFDTYNTLLIDAGRYDFDDMQSWVVRAFQNDVSLLLKYQERFQYVLVDEFQDTSGVQLELLHQLLDFWPDPNVFAVGDDDQSIYRFQGANVKNIVEFKEKYQPKVIVLDENYRSSQPILDASMAVIENNNERLINQDATLTKNLKARGEYASLTIHPRLYEYENSLHEEAAIALQIEKWKNEGVNLSEIAVLYRNHSQAERLVKVLQKRNIPLNIKRSLNVLEEPLVNSLVNTLRYIAYEHKEVNTGEGLLFELMHFKPFGLNPRDIANYAMYCNTQGYGVSWRKALTDVLKDDSFKMENKEAFLLFENNLNDWMLQASNETVQQLFESILSKGKVFQWIMKNPESTFYMELISTFFDFIKNETAKNPLIHVKEVIELVDEMEANDVRIPLDKSILSANGIQFITAHSSKGLEFEYVWVIGCNEKSWKERQGGSDRYKLPTTLLMKSKEDAVEENRRLFYVAATRAKKELYISYPKKLNESKESLPSEFVKEMETALEEKIKPQKVSEVDLVKYQIEAMQTPEALSPVMIDENYIQDFLKKYVLSVTHLNKYLDCPTKFYFENILRVPTARSTYMGYGTAIHGALQRMFVSMLKNPNKEFPDLDYVKKSFEEELIKVKSHFTPIQFDNFLFQGKELVLKPFYEKYIDTFEKNVWVEYAIKNVEVEGVPINGKLDKIELHSNHVAHVIDYKTGKFENAKSKLYPPNEKNELGGDYWRQLVFYKIVVEADRSLNLTVDTGEMNFVEPDKNNEFQKYIYNITKEDVRVVKDQIKQVYQSIQNMEFEKGCNKEDCSWCNFVQSNYTTQPVFSEED